MEFLLEGIMSVTWQQILMYLVGIILIWLAIKKEYEPALLLPMGFGAILVNLPNTGVINQVLAGVGDTNGIIEWLFHVGIEASEALPILLFIGIGAMIDFGPLLSQPVMFLFGAAAQLGIFIAICAAVLLGFDLKDAASIGIIGAADGPTSILVSQILHSKYIGAIAVAAYSYMALVPIVQPFAIRLVTTKKERTIHMEYKPAGVSKAMRIAFPIVVTIIVGMIAPDVGGPCGILNVWQPVEGMRCSRQSFRHGSEWARQFNHPASGNYDLLQHACGCICESRYADDHGHWTDCLCI